MPPTVKQMGRHGRRATSTGQATTSTGATARVHPRPNRPQRAMGNPRVLRPRPEAVRGLSKEPIDNENTQGTTSAIKPPPAHLSKWFTDVCKAGVAPLRAEFAALRGFMPSIQATAFHANAARNRYRDILCHDATRVQLTDHRTGYIHASWVDGAMGPKAFICCQAPLDATVEDFWAMVWQEEVAMVVMLCELNENGKPKCCAYWPQSQTDMQNYGDYSVARTSPPTIADLGAGAKAVLTVLELTRKGCAPRTVTHVKWGEWPDRGVPASSRIMFKLRGMCHEMSEGKPVVVHCSAGIGRTGTLCLADVCLADMDAGKPMDVPAALKRLRAQRMHSIQTDAQYVYVYRTLIEHAASRHGCDRALGVEFIKQVNALK